MEPKALHGHVVGFYERADELVEAVTEFLSEALSQEGTAIIIAAPGHRAAVEAALTAAGHPVAELVDTGRFLTLDAAGVLASIMKNDRIDRAAFASVTSRLFGDTESGRPVHVFGEMVALLWDAGNIAAAIELESLWNDLLDERAFSLYCAYPMASFAGSGDLAAAKHICDRHSNLVRLSAPVPGSELGSGPAFDRLFVPIPTAVREVRRFVREALGRFGEHGRLVEAEVIVTELATNAVVHARSPFRVSVDVAGGEIKIAVRDASPVPPENVQGHPDRHGGRGISIVAALADAWASDAEVDGKTIWATLSPSAFPALTPSV